MERAFASPLANSSIAKPGGGLILLTGMSSAIFAISAGGFGASRELLSSAGRPSVAGEGDWAYAAHAARKRPAMATARRGRYRCNMIFVSFWVVADKCAQAATLSTTPRAGGAMKSGPTRAFTCNARKASISRHAQASIDQPR